MGSAFVAKSPPDGYTLLECSIAPNAIGVSMFKKLPYDPLRDFAAVTNIALGGGSILCVGPQVAARSVEELIALARKPGARISYGSAGTGNTTHLAGALFNVRLGTDMVHVPYRSAGQAIAALMAGEVQVLFASPSSSLQHIKAGRVRALAYNFHKRLELLPVPDGVGDTERLQGLGRRTLPGGGELAEPLRRRADGIGDRLEVRPGLLGSEA